MSDSPFPYTAIGPSPIQLVVPIAVKNAVSAATITFTASSTILCFFMIYLLFFLSLCLCLSGICFSPKVRGSQRGSEQANRFPPSDHP